MRRGLVRSSRYSPGNMDLESLEKLFVGRDPIMEDVLNKVLSSVGPRKEKHYVLLVGPRGSGKTHLVVLAYHRILELLKARQLDQQLVIAFLNEEEWSVASYLDFLVCIVRALATEANGLSQRVCAIYDRFAKEPDAAEVLAEMIIREHVGSKTLLLICENLVELFRGLEDEGQQRWRAFIQQTGFWTILATTPTLFSAVTLQDHPFYGFFTLRELRRLDYSEAHRLLVKKALHDKKTELAEFLQTPDGRARIRAVHHLAAGNHRAYVVLYDFLDRQSLDDLVKPFMQMMDDLTPYYQDKMRQLPPAQRKIVEFLCQAARPTPVKDIAVGCLMTQQTAAKQLGELMTSGFVQKSPIGRQTFCELSEPLMRICIEVKDNRTEHFRLFVEFLRHWFSNRELELRVHDLESVPEVGIDAVHLREALRCAGVAGAEPFVEALTSEAARCLKEGDRAGCISICRDLVREKARPSPYYWLTRALNEGGDLEEAITAGTEALERFPNDPHLHFNLAQTLFGQRRFDEALVHVDRSIATGSPTCSYHCFRSDTLSKLKRYEESIQAAQAAFAIDPAHWHSHDQIIDALMDSGKSEQARDKADALVKEFPNDVGALTVAARCYRRQKGGKTALEILDRALTLDPDNLTARHERGFARFQLRDDSAAREDLEFVLKHEPRCVGTLCLLSDTLIRLEDYSEAARAAEKLICLDPNHYHAYVVLARAHFKSGAVQKGVEALSRLLAYENSAQLRLGAEVALEAQLQGLAQTLIGRAVALKPGDSSLWLFLGRLQLLAGDILCARESAKKARQNGSRSPFLELDLVKVESSQRALQDLLVECLMAFERQDLLRQRAEFVEYTASALAISVDHFGPLYVPPSVSVLRRFVMEGSEEGLLGEILTRFLHRVVSQLKGPWEAWRSALDTLKSEVGQFTDCEIPLAFLDAALGFTESHDQRYLLQLPLELRQLLEEALLGRDQK